MKAKFKLILGRRKNYPLNIELEVYKGIDCRVFIPTGVTLDSAKQWDETRQIIVRHDFAAPYNAMFKTMIKNIERAELEVENRGGVVNKDVIRNAAANKNSIDEIDAIDKFLEYVSKWKVRESTRQTYEGYVRNLKSFIGKQKGRKSAKLFFGDINLQLIEEYHKYLLATFKPSSVGLIHLVIRKCIGIAVREGYLKSSPYENFDIKQCKSEQRPSLTKDQLSRLEAITRKDLKVLANDRVSVSQYESALDRFLFSCYTGLRISDNVSLLKSEISRNANGLVLQKTTQKTGELVTLPLHLLFDGKPQGIASKYLKSNKSSDTLFPPVSDSKLRGLLTKIFSMFGLPTELTFHSARHTCATFLAEKVDNPFVIKDMLGHTFIGTSMSYIQKSHHTAEKKLKQVNWNVDGSTPERNSMEMCMEIKSVCTKRGLNSTQTMLIMGFSMRNKEKYELIKLWVESSNIANMACESLNEKLESLITINA